MNSLDYADPPETFEQRVARWVRFALGFCFRRRLWPTKIVALGASGAAVLHVWAFSGLLTTLGWVTAAATIAASRLGGSVRADG